MTIAIIIVGVVFIALTWWIVRLLTRPPTSDQENRRDLVRRMLGDHPPYTPDQLRNAKPPTPRRDDPTP